MDSGNTTNNSEQSIKDWEAKRKLDNTPFAEITTDQKIDRLVAYIRNFDHTSNRINGVEARISKLENHSHSENGQVVVPLRDNSLPTGGGLMGKIGRHPLD